jgi:uncharacterized protein DUF4202
MIDAIFSEAKVGNPERFAAAIARFDEANARDPNQEVFEKVAYPRELLYARRVSDWVIKLCPDASEALRLAARCQHICRWQVPRDSYEMTRSGYLRWRSDLKALHATKAGEILHELGYEPETVRKIQDLNLKKNFPKDPETRVLEDALCLVFLQYQFEDLAKRTAEEKMVNALRKSWMKMSPAGRAEALKLPFTLREKGLLEQALAADSGTTEAAGV